MSYCFLEWISFRNSLRVCIMASVFTMVPSIAQAEHSTHATQHHKKKNHIVKRHTAASRSHIQSQPLQPVQSVHPAANVPSNGSVVPAAAGALAGGAAAVGASSLANGTTTSTNPAQTGAVTPDNATANQTVSPTGSPVPRFVSLRADEINMRKGPGLTYPITMIYHRKNMPVKILRDFDVWRLVEDVDGEKGWMQGTTLSGSRTFIVNGKPLTVADQVPPKKDENKQPPHTNNRIVGYLSDNQLPAQNANVGDAVVRADANNNAPVIAVLKPGVVGTIKECPAGSDWCKVTVQSYTGWLPKSSFWGLLPEEVLPTK